MVVVNLLKGGSTALLRNYGPPPPPPPLLPYNRNHGVRAMTTTMTNMCGRKWPLSLSSHFSISLHKRYCTTTSASASEMPPSLSSTTTVDKDMNTEMDVATIKNAANTFDIRVGFILRAWRHEEADSPYVEEVNIGEPQSRLICSGLVNYVPLHHLQIQKKKNWEVVQPHLKTDTSCVATLGINSCEHQSV